MKKHTYTDKELFELIAQDNKEAFQRLFNLYYETIARSLTRYSRDPEQIKDWIQDIFIKFWTKRASINISDISNVKPYYYNNCQKFCNKRIEQKKQIAFIISDELAKAEIVDNNLEGKIEHNELLKAYAIALSYLPPRTRDAYYLNREKGLTYNKVVEKMGVSVKTVEV